MKTYSDACLAALAAGGTITSGAIKIYATSAVRLWGGFGTLTLDDEAYTGIGDNALASVSGGALGAQEQNSSVSMSGVDPDTLAGFDVASLRRSPCILWRLIFDPSGAHLLDARPWTRGRVDQVPVRVDQGGTATITAMIEGAARGLGRSGGRMRTDADQRLINAADGGMKFVSYAGQRTLYWGGKIPVVAGDAFK